MQKIKKRIIVKHPLTREKFIFNFVFLICEHKKNNKITMFIEPFKPGFEDYFFWYYGFIFNKEECKKGIKNKLRYILTDTDELESLIFHLNNPDIFISIENRLVTKNIIDSL